MKRQLRKEYKRRVKLILSSKLHGRNKVMAVNTWAVAMLRYGGGVLKWTTEELDGKTGKVMTMYGALHRKSDINSLYTDTFGSSRRRSEIMEGKENAWTVAEAIGKRGF